MAAQTDTLDWSVTEEKIVEAVRRIVEATHPLQVIAFGSRARGDHRPDSDLDLAVILDSQEAAVSPDRAYEAVQDVDMSIDLIVASKAKYELMRPYPGSVYHFIDRQGVSLYDRDHPKRARPDALHYRDEGRISSYLSNSR